MEIRNAVHPEHAAIFDTEELRDHFLIQDLFRPDQIKLVYSYFDRLIVGGICPLNALTVEVDEKIIGAPFLLDRREMGLINVGGPGTVLVDGQKYAMGPRDALYIGMGARELVFSSEAKDNPAKYYLNCAPAHTSYPTTKATFDQAEPVQLGEAAQRRHQKLSAGNGHDNPGIRFGVEHDAGAYPSAAHGSLLLF